MLEKWKAAAKQLKREVQVLALAYNDPRTPWQARVCVAAVVAYALSPIDLIPDFIPVLGYLDDLILVPVGIRFALKLIPPEVIEECRQRVIDEPWQQKPRNWVAAGMIVAVWLLLTAAIVRSVWRLTHTVPVVR